MPCKHKVLIKKSNPRCHDKKLTATSPEMQTFENILKIFWTARKKKKKKDAWHLKLILFFLIMNTVLCDLTVMLPWGVNVGLCDVQNMMVT